MTYFSLPTFDPERQKVVPKNAVVLDPEEFNSTTTQVVKALRSVDPLLLGRLDLTLPYIAGQIEAQTKPPRIPEPGLWGVVEARLGPKTSRRRFLRRYDNNNAGYDWVSVSYGDSDQSLRWVDLVDPVLVREGVSA